MAFYNSFVRYTHIAASSKLSIIFRISSNHQGQSIVPNAFVTAEVSRVTKHTLP